MQDLVVHTFLGSVVYTTSNCNINLQFVGSNLFLWRFLKIRVPKQDSFPWMLFWCCFPWFQLNWCCFLDRSSSSGRLEIHLESFHQLYNTRSQTLQFLGFSAGTHPMRRMAWSTSTIEKTIDDESGSVVKGESLPWWFFWEISSCKDRSHRSIVYLRALSRIICSWLCQEKNRGIVPTWWKQRNRTSLANSIPEKPSTLGA